MGESVYISPCRPLNPTDLASSAGKYPGLAELVPFTVGIEGAFSKFTCSSSGLSASVTELMPTDTNTFTNAPTFARSNAAAFSLNVHQLPASRGGPREGGHCSAAGCCHGIADTHVCVQQASASWRRTTRAPASLKEKCQTDTSVLKFPLCVCQASAWWRRTAWAPASLHQCAACLLFAILSVNQVSWIVHTF